MRRATTLIAPAFALATVLFAGTARTVARAADAPIVDTDVASGIGTAIPDVYGDGSNVAVSTSVASVTYGAPVRVRRGASQYFEVRGTIQGTGWGGEYQPLGGPFPIVDATVHYSYDIPFVLRWHPEWDGQLVYYSHGRASLSLLDLAEQIIGPLNEGRRNEDEGLFLADAMLTDARPHAFFAPNLSGLGGEGQFTMTGLEAPYTGQPLAGTVDAATSRDLARVAKRLVVKLSHRALARTIGVGHSAGALVMQFLNGGVSTILDDDRFGVRLFTGGNTNEPYTPASGSIFDAVVPIAGGDVRVNAPFALNTPMLMIGGQAEFAGINMVLYARRLIVNGADLSNLRVYQVRNLPHNFAEIVLSTPNLNQYVFSDVLGITPHADGDRLLPVIAAAVERAIAWTSGGAPAPASWIEGTPIDLDGEDGPDAIAFPIAGGGTSTLLPALDDPSIDEIVTGQVDTAFDGFVVPRYVQVLATLPHTAQALSLPTVRCRVGGYRFSELSDSELIPFGVSPWKNAGQLQACTTQATGALEQTGLYIRK